MAGTRYSPEYYLAHKERLIAASKKWRRANPETCRANRRMWAANNPTKVRASHLKSNTRIGARFDVLRRQGPKRGIEVALTFAEYVKIVSDATCFHCKEALPAQGHGLDRLDNRQHYTADNCVPCCGWC